ncbi:Kelch repeat-containing protein [Colletotrichum tropicale]|nr:Kelch repeat-containing protein [Colletotrichum tropicale]
MLKPLDIPRLMGQAIWRDNNNNARGFFTWGGEASYSDTVAPSKVWRFQANGGGRGSWANATVSNHEDFTKLKQPMGGAFAQINNVGYYLGGYASSKTDVSIARSRGEPVALPGLVTYDVSSGKFDNVSLTGFGDYGTFRGGSMEAVPFGPERLLLVLGGRQAVPSVRYNDDWKWMNFSQVSIYDPQARKWHTQQTTGAWPTGREKFCTVGIDGTDNTYDIFIYGGRTGENDDDFSDEAYVLTLPGFNFFKASNTSSTARNNHACVQIGKRHMLSIGGTSSRNFTTAWTEKDTWNRGLGVFDMTQMSWVNRYNNSAEPYVSPQVVKQWYSEGGQSNISWSSDSLKSLFAQRAQRRLKDMRCLEIWLPPNCQEIMSFLKEAV